MPKTALSVFLLILVVLVAAQVQPARALEAGRRKVSLAQALEIAMQRNRVVRAADLKKDAVAEAAGEARGAMLPRLDAVENISESNRPTVVFSNLLDQQEFSQSNFSVERLNFPPSFSNFQSQFRLTQQLFAGGRLLAGWRAAKYAGQAEGWRALRERQEVAFRVIDAYYAAVLDGRQMAVVERALASARAHQKQASDLFSRGMVVKADLLRSGVLVGTLEQELIQAQNRLYIAWAALGHALGIEDETIEPLEAPGELDTATRRARASLSDQTATALGARPELRAAEAEVHRAREQLRIAEADYLPSLSIVAAYENDSQRLSRAGNSYSVFVAGQFNLFNGLATRSRTASAKTELMRAEVMEEELKRGIALEVETAWRGLSAALEQLKVAERDVAWASEALAIIKDRYGSGLATNLEVLDAETSNKQAETRSVEARVAVQVAAAALDLASGVMPGRAGESGR